MATNWLDSWLYPVCKKICFTSSNYHESLVFLPQLRNRILHLPQLFKSCILPPSSGFEDWFATVATAVTVAKRSSKPIEGRKIEGGEVFGFVVAGGKPNFHDS
jgi:hypothetical protein